MNFSAALAIATLLASASAIPEFSVEHRAARRTAEHHTNPIDLANSDGSNDLERSAPTGTYNNKGPGGWGGAVQDHKTGVSEVQATFTVPTPSVPPNGDGSTLYGGSAWVGIGGYGTNTLWQTGISWYVSDNGPSFNGWYEWFPADEVPFSGFEVGAGDTVALKVVALGSHSGTAYITNKSTNQSVHYTITDQPTLPQDTAEWIVEDFSQNHESIPFAAFTDVTFSGCSYVDAYGTGTDLSDSVLKEVGEGIGAPFTQCSASGDSVSCSYIGNGASSS